MIELQTSWADRLRRASVSACLVAGIALLTSGVSAQSFQSQAQPPSRSPETPPSADQVPPPSQGDPSVVGTPGYRPGFFDAFGRWVQESTAGFNANLGTGWGSPKGVSDAAASAARNTADVAKGAAEMTRGAADAMTNVARDTAGALTRLPTSRVVIGRERCTVAPNGAPDCRVAAEAMCKAAGYASGSSIDFETAEVCPSTALLSRWRGEPAPCATHNFVTRSLCQ